MGEKQYCISEDDRSYSEWLRKTPAERERDRLAAKREYEQYLKDNPIAAFLADSCSFAKANFEPWVEDFKVNNQSIGQSIKVRVPHRYRDENEN